jgi:hypothetical protein
MPGLIDPNNTLQHPATTDNTLQQSSQIANQQFTMSNQKSPAFLTQHARACTILCASFHEQGIISLKGHAIH